MYFLSAILQRIPVNGKTAGDGKVTGAVIDFLLTDYFVERITANTFSTCHLLQYDMAMKVYVRSYTCNCISTIYITICIHVRVYIFKRKTRTFAKSLLLDICFVN